MNEFETLDIEQEEDQEPPSFVEYDITTYPSDFTLNVLYDMWKKRSIVIPDYQRDFVWTIKQSSLLIESFLIGLPVPPVFFYIDTNNKNLVIDGQQRLLSIFYFFEGYFGNENEKGKRQVFRLKGLNEKNPYFEKTFNTLEIDDRRKLEGSVLRAINVRQLSPQNEYTSVFHIFERLNTGGTPLKSQEIRNCVFRGELLNRLRKLNEDTAWRTILGKNLPDKHQTDVELILRAFGLCYHLDKYEKPMKDFLNKIAGKYQKPEKDEQIEKFEKSFKKATKLISDKLRKKPFAVRGPLNTSLFDSIFCTIINNINALPEDLKNRYESLLKDEKFIEYTTLATSDAAIVKKRFEYVEKKLIGK